LIQGINILDESSSISDQQDPIADLEHPSAFRNIDSAECKRIFQIGGWRWLIADLMEMIRQVC
jgi:hypothetical protein